MPRSLAFLSLLLLSSSCLSKAPATLAATVPGTGPMVKFDPYHLPFPDIPLPNDFATVYDATSPTKRRVNASILQGTTKWERSTRAELDKMNGWGTLAPLSVAFDAPIDPEVIYARHFDDTVDFSDDAVFVIDVTPSSPDFCKAVPLDVGQGNYPQVLTKQQMFDSDPRGTLQQAMFEEVEEDTNGNGILDPGEDTDSDGVLDHPNTRDGTVMTERMEFYERETNTLIMKPLMPMREQTTYAAVLTTRLTSKDGAPVRSPFAGVNDASQSLALAPLPQCLTSYGLSAKDIAFAWSFTTQNISNDYKTARDGLYGLGPIARVSTDFPPQMELDDVTDPGPNVTNTKVVPASVLTPIVLEILSLTSATPTEVSVLQATYGNIDYIVAGTITSPQFFPRNDAAGNPLPYYSQVWDLDAAPRPEAVPFWLFVPKNRKGPAPVTIFIHGLGGSKFDGALFAGLMASYGIATLAFDAPSHGLSLNLGEAQGVQTAFARAGIAGLANRLLTGRALDLNGDGSVDSGADYFSSYVFHTRDMVRQTMVDFMQIVRTLRTFDGTTRWSYDIGHTGSPGLAGDFDGDGVLDVGGTSSINVLGGSLGGITGSLVSGLEPAVKAAVAILPGGLLNEIGPRSALTPVRDGVMLRILGPIFYGDQGKIMLRMNDAGNSDIALAIADLPTVATNDTVVLHNHTTGEYRCGAVQPSGTFRVSVSSDEGDSLELRFYHGPPAPQARTGCVEPTSAPYADITALGQDVVLDTKTIPKGSPLVALTDGFGERRSTPDLRRFFGIAQIALESADPMNWAPYWNGTRAMTYGNGETVHTNVMLIPSNGDPGVPIADGIALGRSAGFIPYNVVDPRWNVPANQELINTWATEGTYRVGHFHDSKGDPVLEDVEYLESVLPGADDGFDVPRLVPPLRLMKQDSTDGSWSGFILPMLIPQGEHTFLAPDPSAGFDLGTYLLNVTGHYLITDGFDFSWDACQVTSSCSWTTFPLK